MEKYDKEIEIRDTEIQILKEKREEQFTQLEELAKLVCMKIFGFVFIQYS